MNLEDVAPIVPPRVARGGNRCTRWLGRVVLHLAGWRVTGNLPDTEKILVIGAPHTSNWDWVVAVFVMWALAIRMTYLVKDTAFWWPAGWFLRLTGAMPVNRRNPAGIATEVANSIRAAERIIVVITPEGTRSRVEKWKTGFLRIAQEAAVPIAQISFDYPSRTLHLGPVAELSGDIETDITRIRAYYRQFTGCRPENQSP
jgi:1-acyl-sn-glycerol-3-phosphate acyltransferase